MDLTALKSAILHVPIRFILAMKAPHFGGHASIEEKEVFHSEEGYTLAPKSGQLHNLRGIMVHDSREIETISSPHLFFIEIAGMMVIGVNSGFEEFCAVNRVR